MAQTAGTASSGKLVLLQLGIGTGNTTTIATARTNSFTINHSVVDTTTKKDNGWGSILAGGGVTDMTIALDGVFENTVYDKSLRQYGIDGSSNEYTILTGNGDKFEGNFVVTSYATTGVYNTAESFTVSLKNNGEIVYTASI
jgi:predicted secreted protein